MKFQYLIWVLLLILTTSLAAQDIDRSWGISAGLYENQLNEISLSYGISNRTLIMFFTNLGYTNQSTDIDTKEPFVATANKKVESLSLLAGPEIRGYFHLGRVAPFGGLRASAGWQYDKTNETDGDWLKKRQFQINIGATYGAEYFIKNALSVYISFNLFNYSLTRVVNESYADFSGTKIEDTTRQHQIRFTQNPAIFLKIYF